MKKSFPAELVYQVFSLLIAFILVHAVYVTLIRPQANAFLEQQAANMLADPEYVQQRSFYVVIKDYEQETCFILMLWAFSIMGYKGRAVYRQQSLLEQDLLLAEGFVQIEGFYVVAGDQDVFNNFRWRGVGNQYQGGNNWSFPNATPQTPGPIVFSWGDAQAYFEPRTEGDAVAAVRVVSLGGGSYRYEYNVYNMNVDREFESFSVPVHESVNLSSFGLHFPKESEETQYAMTSWTPSYDGAVLTWSAPAPVGPGQAHPNTLRYGTMYSFWFTADVPSMPGSVSLAQYLPGAEGAVTAGVLVPEAPVLVGDINGDGVVDGVDLALLLGAWGAGPGPADLNDDGNVDGVDLALLLGNWT